MKERLTVKRTNSNDTGFQRPITGLDNELGDELNELQGTYDLYHKAPDQYSYSDIGR